MTQVKIVDRQSPYYDMVVPVIAKMSNGDVRAQVDPAVTVGLVVGEFRYI